MSYKRSIIYYFVYFTFIMYHRDHKKRLQLTWDATEIFENLGRVNVPRFVKVCQP
jgi:hypothetical protein